MKTSRTVFLMMLAVALLTGVAATAQLPILYGSSGWEYSLDGGATWPAGEAPWGGLQAGVDNPCPALFAPPFTPSPPPTLWPTGTNASPSELRVRRTIVLAEQSCGVTVTTRIDNDIQVVWDGVNISGGVQTHEGCAEINPLPFVVPDALVDAGAHVLEVTAVDRGAVSFLDIEVAEIAVNCGSVMDCGTATASAAVLWPPNHKYRTINVEGVFDSGGDEAEITIDEIHQDESVLSTGVGAGDTCPDGRVVGTDSAQVRAERNGNPKSPGNGRVYTIAFTATGGGGESCSGTVKTCVPHDQRPGATCVDDGPLFDSTVCP